MINGEITILHSLTYSAIHTVPGTLNSLLHDKVFCV